MSVGSALDGDEVKECTEEGREEAEIPVGPEVGEGDGVAEAEVVPGEGTIEEDERDEMSPGDIFEEAEASFVEGEGIATRAYRKGKEGQGRTRIRQRASKRVRKRECESVRVSK